MAKRKSSLPNGRYSFKLAFIVLAILFLALFLVYRSDPFIIHRLYIKPQFSPSASDTQTVTNHESGYSISYPPDFHYESVCKGVIWPDCKGMLIKTDMSQRFPPTFSKEPYPTYDITFEVINQNKAGATYKFRFDHAGNPETVSIGGRNATQYTFDSEDASLVTGPSFTWSYQKMTVFSVNGSYYIVTYSNSGNPWNTGDK